MTMRWYIVHAYSNFEKKVAESIREQAGHRGLADKFEEIMVPTEQVVEVRRGRKIASERKFFPGYVLVKCDLTDDVYFSAGLALCQAAGCVITSLHGRPLDTQPSGLLVAADPATHRALLKLITEAST